MMKRGESGAAIIRVHYSADPEKGDAWVQVEKPKYTEAYWEQEMEIRGDALLGTRVYPEFDSAVHVIPDELVPKRGCRFMSIDPHPRTPHACLWVLIDHWSDWYVYRELWPSICSGLPWNVRDTDTDKSYTIREYAETIAYLEGNELEYSDPETDQEYARYVRKPGGERIVARLMDQAGKGFNAAGEGQKESYARRYERFGIYCEDPIKSHEVGEDAIRALLKLRAHDTYGLWPRIHFAQSCREIILEMTRHRYKSHRPSDERELSQAGIEARCHQIDNLRYLVTARLQYIESSAS